MFRGEKTRIFWWGLIIFGAAIVELFSAFWTMYMLYPPSYPAYPLSWRYSAPFIFAGVVFLLIGLYMMMSGLPKEETKTA